MVFSCSDHHREGGRHEGTTSGRDRGARGAVRRSRRCRGERGATEPDRLVDEPDEPVLPYGLPPISADPPLHTWTRRLLLPWFSHTRVTSYEAMTRGLCTGLIDTFHADKVFVATGALGTTRLVAQSLGM